MANNSIFNQTNRDSYDKIAEEFSSSRAYCWRDVELFCDYLKDGDKVLDLGCGNGRMVQLFGVGTGHCPVRRSARVEYLGVDSSEKLIGIARKKYPDKEFQVMDALDLDLPEKTFDAVLSVSVLNHFAKKDHQRFVENIKKVLKPNGYLLMANWNLWNVKNRKGVLRLKIKDLRLKNFKQKETLWKGGGVEASLYYYAFTKSEVKRLLAENGFEIIKNCYSRRGKKSNLFFGENIITIARNDEF